MESFVKTRFHCDSPLIHVSSPDSKSSNRSKDQSEFSFHLVDHLFFWFYLCIFVFCFFFSKKIRIITCNFNYILMKMIFLVVITEFLRLYRLSFRLPVLYLF